MRNLKKSNHWKIKWSEKLNSWEAKEKTRESWMLIEKSGRDRREERVEYKCQGIEASVQKIFIKDYHSLGWVGFNCKYSLFLGELGLTVNRAWVDSLN